MSEVGENIGSLEDNDEVWDHLGSLSLENTEPTGKQSDSLFRSLVNYSFKCM